MPEHRTPKSAGQPETSESEEMYLITILRAAEDGHDGPLGLATLAGRLGVSAASANEMVRKMAVRGLLDYQPYKGASLTPSGSTVARRVLRTRRLWARFLADRLGYTPQEADEMACDLEHVTSGEAAERLAAYLGHPDSGPLGHPIPTPGEAPSGLRSRTLDVVLPGEEVEVIDHRADSRAAGFLSASGMGIGDRVVVAAAGPEGVLVTTASGDVHLDAGLAASVLVRAGGSA